MGLNGIDYITSRFSVMSIAQILIQVGLVVLFCLTEKDTKMPEISIFTSVVSLMIVVVIFLFYILRKADWDIDCCCMTVFGSYIIISILHLVCFLWMTGDFAVRMGKPSMIPADIAALIIVSAFLHLCSSVLFGVDVWMRDHYRELLG